MFVTILPDVQTKTLQAFRFVFAKWCDDRFEDRILQKFSALVWNHPTVEVDDGPKLKHLNQNDAEVCGDFWPEALLHLAVTLLIEIIKCSRGYIYT